MSRDDLITLLDQLRPDLEAVAAPWAVIGSGALMLLGVPVDVANDLDVVTGVEGAGRLRRLWADWRCPEDGKRPDGAFRSEDFARYETPWGPVEVMGGLMVLQDGEMEPLLIGEREPGQPIPTAQEQLRILEVFGRPKDLAKAAVLRCHLMG